MENLPPPVPEPPPSAAPESKPPRMSLASKLLNVFAVPSEVFQEVKDCVSSPANWVVPALLLALTGAVAGVITLSQPAIQQQLREQQAKKIEQMVQAGKMTRQDADKAQEMINKIMSPTLLKIFGGAGALGGSFARVVWWAFILWLAAKWFLNSRLDFSKTLEAAGLALMISVLGTIVSVLLTVNLDRMGATPSLALAVHDFDLNRKSHLFLGAANVFTIWQVGVLSVALSKLAGVPFIRAALPIFIFWIGQECLLITIGLGAMAL